MKRLTKTIHDPYIYVTQLNQKIRGWINYHHCCNNIWKVWSRMNNYLYECLMKWGTRRHGNKTKKWVFNRYWRHIAGRWTFYIETTLKGSIQLIKYDLNQKKIRTRISQNVNVFDLQNKKLIVKKQLVKKIYLPYKKEKLWRKQKALCFICSQYLNPLQPNILDIHPIIPRKDGGSDKLTNLVLLHEHCHYESHTNRLTS